MRRRRGAWGLMGSVVMVVGTPTSIVMCPATCDLFGQGGTVPIALGCETVVAIPN